MDMELIQRTHLVRSWILMPALITSCVCGCSIKRMTVNQLGNALASGGTTFASDNDPELVRAALPFSLKLTESLLAENPHHRGLLLAAASGFTQFSYAFVQQDADRAEESNISAAEPLRTRARNLYLRGRDYGLRGLEESYPGFGERLRRSPTQAVAETCMADVPLLYWTAAAWGSAISVSKSNPQLISEQVIVEALIDRALDLKEDYDHGAIHSFLITYEMARQGGKGNPAERARRHFERAVALSAHRLAGPFVAYAESVMVKEQNAVQFESLLEEALSIDPDALPESRLVNLIMQERARWLLSRMDELFLISNKS
jgi:predicted anti-sigma-YlaC factor YlaD